MTMNKRHMVIMKRSCSCSMPGVWRAVAHNEGAAVIYHSPKACGHVMRDMGLGGHYRSMARKEFVSRQYTAPLVTSNLQEEHSIFGGVEQLRQCITYVVERYQPQYIMIANSCVAGVIGDDALAIAAEVERDCGIPIMTVPCSGFLDGEYYGGYYHAAKNLADRFMDRQPQSDNKVTLLGDSGGPYSQNAKELQRLLETFGLQVYCQFPGYVSLEEIRQVPASMLCIPLGGRPQSYSWMRKLAVDLQMKFGVPFHDHDYPIGWQGTKSWIRHLGELLDRKREVILAESIQEKRLRVPVEQCRIAMMATKVVLCIGRPLIHFQTDWVFELFALAGVKPAGIILFSGLTGEQKTAMRQELQKHMMVPVFEEEAGEDVLQAADLLITTHELEGETKRQFCLPMLPPLGVGGLIEMLNKLTWLARQFERRGVVFYG